MLRTHTCGELNSTQIGEIVALSGWVASIRNHGGLIFINLRDRYGITQVILDPATTAADLISLAETIKPEWVLQIIGPVRARGEGQTNPEMKTGAIEIPATEIKILSQSKLMPFELNEDKTGLANEALRLKYRYLDLRRPKIQEMLRTKDRMITIIREYFHAHDFTEVQTPILASSSPEGARDFLIPSRLHPGKFYALPQAPQQFKQLLMVGGLDRYFQIAPCFRDEDPRLDRHYGEFYQLDMEMSFVEQDDIFQIMEPIMKELTEKISTKKLINLWPDGRFRQISWQEAIDRYGSDKPDTRFALELQDVSEAAKKSDFKIFTEALAAGGVVKALKIPGGAKFSRREIDELIAVAKKRGLGGLAYIISRDHELSASFAKAVTPEALQVLAASVSLEVGDLVFLAAGPWRLISEALGAVRNEVGLRLGLKDNSVAAWIWVVDFPMYDYSDLEEGKVDFSHNPFSMPQGGLEALQSKDPFEILAYQFDLVLNGFEVSSGGIRNHDPEIMYAAFNIAGYSKEEVDKKFGAMINAFSYGAPPHGGNAPGIDRILMVLNDWDSIRDIYAFPKDNQGRDLMSDAPASVSEGQLEELNINLKPQKNV
ncbi:MAG: aspartate--tRNA ligase [Candidatus Parcubacteria bacterium]|nr:MAG: aspartate--tRNA ligase [Candidatus Parcubacteria bacterium]